MKVLFTNLAISDYTHRIDINKDVDNNLRKNIANIEGVEAVQQDDSRYSITISIGRAFSEPIVLNRIEEAIKSYYNQS